MIHFFPETGGKKDTPVSKPDYIAPSQPLPPQIPIDQNVCNVIYEENKRATIHYRGERINTVDNLLEKVGTLLNNEQFNLCKNMIKVDMINRNTNDILDGITLKQADKKRNIVIHISPDMIPKNVLDEHQETELYDENRFVPKKANKIATPPVSKHKDCTHCENGKIKCEVCLGNGTVNQMPCEKCNHKGKIKCTFCNGIGKINIR